MTEKKTLKINFNDYVTVTLTKTGAELINAKRKEFNSYTTKHKLKDDFAENDNLTMQMWELFDYFGGINYFGREAPFYGCLMFVNTYEEQS